ncbi:MAG TPA: hypothetical protein V6C88_19810, partial [Chroococcidiopsis sp.]
MSRADMRESKKTRIHEIQARLQAIQAGPAGAESLGMIELTPETSVAKGGRSQQAEAETMTRYRSSGATAVVDSESGAAKSNSRGYAGEADALAGGDPLANRVRSLNQKSNRVVQYWQPAAFEQPLSAHSGQASHQAQLQRIHRAQALLDQHTSELLQSLDGQVKRINQLSSAQEAAILELKATFERAERTLKTIYIDDEMLALLDIKLPELSCEAAAIPYVDDAAPGTFVLTSRPVDLFKAEREAVSVAESLRSRSANGRSPEFTPRRRVSKPDMGPTWLQMIGRASLAISRALVGSMTPSSAPRLPRTRLSSPTAAVSAPLRFTAQEGITWLVGAVVSRVALNMVLNAFPGLWLPVIGVIIIPAAIAV